MSRTVSRRSGGNRRNFTFAPFVTIDPKERARRIARRPAPLKVQFAEFELPDTPENKLIFRPITRRWVPRGDFGDSTDEDGPNDEEDRDNAEASEMASDDEGVSSPAAGQRPSSSNITASSVNHASGVSPNSRVSTMVQPIRRTSQQLNRAPVDFFPFPHSSSLSLSGNAQLSGNALPITPTPNRSMKFRGSQMSWRSRNASSGSGGRVAESTRNGKRRVEISLLSDDEDDDPTPDQHASSAAGQRSRKLRCMTPCTGSIPGQKTSLRPTSTDKSALRLAQPSGIERRLYTTAPEATFDHAPTSIQSGQTQTQTSSVQGQVTTPGSPAARMPIVQAQSTQIKGEPTASQTQQSLAKDIPSSAQGNVKEKVRATSPALFVEQPQNNPSFTAPWERSSIHKGRPPDDSSQSVVDDLGDQHGLPAYDGPTRPPMALGSRPGALLRPNINALLQAQQDQGTVNDGSPTNDRPFDQYNPMFDIRSRPLATASISRNPPRVDADHATGDTDPSSNAGLSTQIPLKTRPVVDSELVKGTKRFAVRCKDSVRKEDCDRDESDSDNNDVLANFSRFKKHKQPNSSSNSSQPGGSQNGSDSRSQEAETQPKGQSSAASFSQESKVAPETTGIDAQGQQVVQPNTGFMDAIERQKRPATVFSGLEADRIKACQMGPGRAMYSSAYHEQQRTAHGLPRKDANEAEIGRVHEQHIEKYVRRSAIALEDDDEDEDEEAEHYEYPVEYSDGEDEYSPTKLQIKLRALDKVAKKPMTKTVSDKPSRIVTLRIPTKALHLFQPPKGPSLPIGADFFSRIPIEVRRKIYRELLKADGPIIVQRGWSQVYRRQQLDLHASILAVSMMHNADASIVLYGENVFRYVLRDDGFMVQFEVGKKRGERTLPLKKQIDNLRYLELEVEPNRIDLTASLAFYAALETLVDNKATTLIRMTVDLSPRLQKDAQGKKGMTKDWVPQREWFTRARGNISLLKELKARFLAFDIHLEENNHSKATSLRTIIDMRPEIGDDEVSAELMRHNDHLKSTMSIEARKELARESVDERNHEHAYMKLDKMHSRLEQAVLKGAPYMMRRGWFQEFTSERKQRKRKQRKTIQADDDGE